MLGKDRLSASNLHQLFNPLDAADDGIVPLLKKDARTKAKLLWLWMRYVQDCLCRRQSVVAFCLFSQNAREHCHRLENLCNTSLIAVQHRVSATRSLARYLRLHVGIGDDEVGLKLSDRLEIGIAKR